MLVDPSFLRVPETEKAVNEKLNEALEARGQPGAKAAPKVKQFALRETVIEFVQNRWLKRTDSGIMRESVGPDRFIALFAMRLHIERTAMRKVFEDSERTTISLALGKIVDSQGLLTESKSDQEKVDWFRHSVALHVSMARQARLLDWADTLEGYLWRIRTGCFIPLESEEVRRAAVEEHRQIISKISDGADWKDEEEEFIEQHLRQPMIRAAISSGIIKSGTEKRAETLWQLILKLSGDHST